MVTGLDSSSRTKPEWFAVQEVPGSHVALRQQWHLQHLGAAHHLLLAAGGHHLPRNPVHLVEGVGPKTALVGRANEQQQTERPLTVAPQLCTHTNADGKSEAQVYFIK